MHAYRAKVKAALVGVNLRVAVAFWLFGLINNIFYVIILSAALDLVGPSIPKATVLLSSIIPGLATKIVVPYIIHLIPYSARVIILAVLSTCGMLTVALSPSQTTGGIAAKVAGIVLANISSGAGEVHFLALTHFYGTTSLAAWGSGTGGAGLLGAGAYALATTTLGFSVQSTLLSSAVIPVGMVLSFFSLLPLDPLTAGAQRKIPNYEAVPGEDDDHGVITEERAGLLDQPEDQHTSPAYQHNSHSYRQQLLHDLRIKLSRAKTLVVPYMLPLFLVYVAEYTINQGVAPTLLFPLESTPFRHFRAFYSTYGAIYQLGVFISRSSLPFVRIRTLYVPSILQVFNLTALTVHALYPFIPSVWFVFAIIFWEGLLGGLVYVSTYAAVREEVPDVDREFSLGAVTVSDSGGIFVAGLLGVVMESSLCSWQVAHGRDWCRRL
ncbi:battenin CLN3 protein [Recurvomyces mirabilis]|uniref:Protein BTN n=1 Tax=Recurvomyces mirabilis TaxID=574656 RepID=A0AAE0WNJ1_9PEZI|nr:battenin CLN3 protein [Recurvomyces mirabilis]KAK5158442.1 battenin CLN3 protein [Recurvomyces mirabilis]